MMTVMSTSPGGRGGRSAEGSVDGGDVPGGAARSTSPDLDALAGLHRDHYASLVRLATLVVGDVGLAEQLSQDAFVKLQLRWAAASTSVSSPPCAGCPSGSARPSRSVTTPTCPRPTSPPPWASPPGR